MKVYCQLEEVCFEQLSEDPTNLPEGRVWENTTGKKIKVVLNGTVKTLSTSESEVSNTNQVLTTQIQDLAVTNPKLADNAVSTSKIVDGAVTGDKITNGTITNNKLATLRSRTALQVLRGFSTNTDVILASMNVPANAKPFEFKFGYKYDGLGALGAIYGINYLKTGGTSHTAPSARIYVYKYPTGGTLNFTDHIYAVVPIFGMQFVATGDPAAAVTEIDLCLGNFRVIEDAPSATPMTYEFRVNHNANQLSYGNIQLIREDLY